MNDVKPVTSLQNIAEELHKRFCNHNHADDCFWFYEKSWNEYCHNYWLMTAQEIILLVKNNSETEPQKNNRFNSGINNAGRGSLE